MLAGRVGFLVLLFLNLLVVAADARSRRLDRALVQPRITNGVATADVPSVGALLFGGTPDTAEPWCSGTMIGCHTMLTARHCVRGNTPADHLVFLPHAGFFTVASIAENPTAGPGTWGGDLALVRLAAPVGGIRPSRLNTLGAVPDSTSGTIVGYGLPEQLDEAGIGIRRRGAVKTAPCPFVEQSPPYAQPAGALCFAFWKPFGPPGSNSGTCSGDSGGPLFVDLGEGPMVAGVTASGVRPDGLANTCLPTQFGIDARVDAHLAWLQAEGGADLANTACGAGPQVGDAGSVDAGFTGTVDAVAPERRMVFDVPYGSAQLRITMNGAFLVTDNPNDFDLYVKHGSPPTTSDFDCRRDGAGQLAACLVDAPAPGAWHVLVRRKSGGGQYQVTATALARDCAQPGTDGLSCDDTNSCTSAEVCQAGMCGGTAAPDATPCDDGNQCTGSDACQAGLCIGVALTDGTPCDDGDRCSRPDTCAGGACSGPAPAVGCALPGVPDAGALLLRDDVRDGKDKMSWKWSKGPATPLGALGDPTTTTDYALCLYDRAGGMPSRKLKLPLPAGSAWSESSTTGFRWKDGTLSLGGVTALIIRSGEAGKAKISLSGKSHALGMPDLPLAKDPAVTVQLVNPLACWETTFGASSRNDDRQFKARTD